MSENVQNIWEKYPAALPMDTILAGKYMIKDVLGQGGFGITYLAEDYQTKTKVAVKEYFPETMAMRSSGSLDIRTYTDERSENFRFGMERFLEEAEVLAQFQGNPHIVGVQQYFEENATAYFVMDYIEGIDFKTYIRQKGGKLPWEDVWRVMQPVMEALDTVHSKGLVHRDVTPDNIVIADDGTVKLLDFGAARYSLGDRSRSLDVVLKPGYAPKEQYVRRGKQGPYTDVYSVAACFYAALSGYLPPESLERMEEDNLVPLSARGVQLPDRVEDAILKALEVRAEDRFQSMSEFEQAIDGRQPAPVQEVVSPQIQEHGKNTAQVTTKNSESANLIQESEDAAEEAAQASDDRGGVIYDGTGQSAKKKKGMIAIAAACAVLCVVVGMVVGRGSFGKSEESVLDLHSNDQGHDIAADSQHEERGNNALINSDYGEMGTEAWQGNGPKIVDYSENVLMEDKVADIDEAVATDGEDVWVLGKAGLERSSIASITFLDTLKDMPNDAWDVSQDQNGLVMAWILPSGKVQAEYDLYIAGQGGVWAGSGNSLFAFYDNAERIQFNNCFHTDNMTDARAMFCNCKSLTSLDLSELDTSQVTDMGRMFYRSAGLSELNLSEFNTSQVTDMSYMFSFCRALNSLDLSAFDTSQVVDMSGMFEYCQSLEQLDISGFDTSRVTSMAIMFSECHNLSSLDISSFDTSQVVYMSSMFAYCQSLERLDISGFDTSSVTSMALMFNECHNLIGLDISSFDTSQVTNMRGMFGWCSNLVSLDLSHFDTGNVTDMSFMFDECTSLSHLDVSSFDTSNVTDMSFMFAACESLTNLDLSSFDPVKAIKAGNVDTMFYDSGIDITDTKIRILSNIYYFS